MLRAATNSVPQHLQSLSLAALICTAATLAAAAEPAGENWHRDWPAAWKDSQVRGRPIVLFITTDHCYYCEKMNNDTYRDDNVIDELESGFVLASIDSDRHPRLVRKLKVDSFPTTMIVGPDAHVIDSMSGYLTPQELRLRLKAAGAKLAAK